MGVFDRLQRHIDDKEKDGGITALDLVDLPTSLRKIMRLMLRQLQMTYPQLCEAMSSMPEKDRLTGKELDAALASLTQQFWLVRLGEGERATYRVNLRRKAGSNLSKNIWANLDARMKKSDPEGEV